MHTCPPLPSPTGEDKLVHKTALSKSHLVGAIHNTVGSDKGIRRQEKDLDFFTVKKKEGGEIVNPRANASRLLLVKCPQETRVKY